MHFEKSRVTAEENVKMCYSTPQVISNPEYNELTLGDSTGGASIINIQPPNYTRFCSPSSGDSSKRNIFDETAAIGETSSDGEFNQTENLNERLIRWNGVCLVWFMINLLKYVLLTFCVSTWFQLFVYFFVSQIQSYNFVLKMVCLIDWSDHWKLGWTSPLPLPYAGHAADGHLWAVNTVSMLRCLIKVATHSISSAPIHFALHFSISFSV